MNLNWKKVIMVVAIFCASLSADQIKTLPEPVQKGVELLGMIALMGTNPQMKKEE